MEVICGLLIFVVTIKEKQSLFSVPRRTPPPSLVMRTNSSPWTMEKTEGRPGGQKCQRYEQRDLIIKDKATFPEIVHLQFILPRFTSDKCSRRHTTVQIEKILQSSQLAKAQNPAAWSLFLSVLTSALYKSAWAQSPEPSTARHKVHIGPTGLHPTSSIRLLGSPKSLPCN